MQGIHSYLVEINLDWYKRISINDIEFDTPARSGQKGKIEPRHGKVLATINGSKVKKGDTLFFLHYSLYGQEDIDGKTLVLVDSESAMGYCSHFPDIWSYDNDKHVEIKSLGFLVARKIDNPLSLESEKAAIKDVNIPTHLSRIYKAIDSDLDIKKGDVIWTYGGSECFIDYLPNTAFLDRKYITYNQTKNKPLNGYVPIELVNAGVPDNGFVTEGSRKKSLIGTGVSKVKTKGINFDDPVRWNISPPQMSPVSETLWTVPYHLIISKLEAHNIEGA